MNFHTGSEKTHKMFLPVMSYFGDYFMRKPSISFCYPYPFLSPSSEV